MRVQRSERGFNIDPGGPGRRATARLRRACAVAHSRPAVDPTETALDPLASSRQGFSPARSIETLRVGNLTQNRRKIFHLNCVPRQLVFEPGDKEVNIKCYLHSDHFASKGWYGPAERTIRLKKPFRWA